MTRTNLSDSLSHLDLPLLNVYEACAVRAGIKPICRISCEHCQLADIERLGGLLRLNIDCRIVSTQVVSSVLSSEFANTTQQANQFSSKLIAILSSDSSNQLAIEYLDAENSAGDDLVLGRMLGYPECCCRAYLKYRESGDWLGTMQQNTDLDKPLYTACNRVCREIFGLSVLPDFFPCSFNCGASRLLADRVDAAARKFGLEQELDRTWSFLSRPVRIDSNELVVLAAGANSHHYGAGLLEDMLLNWIR